MNTEEPTPGSEFVSIAIVYDSVLSGSRALEVYQSLTKKLPENYHVDLKICGIEELKREEKEVLQSFFQEADLVLLALDKDRPVPAEVSAWISSMATTDCDRALALILTGRGPGIYLQRNKTELEELARQSGLDFFVTEPGSPMPWVIPPPQETPETAGLIFIERATEGWGLND